MCCGVIRDSRNLVIFLSDCVVIGSGLGVLDCTELGCQVILRDCLLQLAILCTFRHRSTVYCSQSECEAFRLAPVIDRLGCFQASFSACFLYICEHNWTCYRFFIFCNSNLHWVSINYCNNDCMHCCIIYYSSQLPFCFRNLVRFYITSLLCGIPICILFITNRSRCIIRNNLCNSIGIRTRVVKVYSTKTADITWGRSGDGNRLLAFH